MISKNNIEMIIQELTKKNLDYNFSIREIAAFKMLQHQKIRKLLNGNKH